MFDPAIGNPAYGWNAFNDYNGIMTAATTYYGETGGWVSSAGAGTGISTNSGFLTDSPGRQGTVALFTGTTAAGYTVLRVNGCEMRFGAGYGVRAMTLSQAFLALSTAGDEYIARYGFYDNTVGGAPVNGAYFLYDRATFGDVWVLRNINVAGNLTVPTAVVPVIAPGTNWQKLRVEADSSATRSDFWIDNLRVSAAGGLNTNMPTGANLYMVEGITKTVGIAALRIEADYAQFQSYPVTLR
jgi:hypothetical protein